MADTKKPIDPEEHKKFLDGLDWSDPAKAVAALGERYGQAAPDSGDQQTINVSARMAKNLSKKVGAEISAGPMPFDSFVKLFKVGVATDALGGSGGYGQTSPSPQDVAKQAVSDREAKTGHMNISDRLAGTGSTEFEGMLAANKARNGGKTGAEVAAENRSAYVFNKMGDAPLGKAAADAQTTNAIKAGFEGNISKAQAELDAAKETEDEAKIKEAAGKLAFATEDYKKNFADALYGVAGITTPVKASPLAEGERRDILNKKGARVGYVRQPLDFEKAGEKALAETDKTLLEHYGFKQGVGFPSAQAEQDYLAERTRVAPRVRASSNDTVMQEAVDSGKASVAAALYAPTFYGLQASAVDTQEKGSKPADVTVFGPNTQDRKSSIAGDLARGATGEFDLKTGGVHISDRLNWSPEMQATADKKGLVFRSAEDVLFTGNHEGAHANLLANPGIRAGIPAASEARTEDYARLFLQTVNGESAAPGAGMVGEEDFLASLTAAKNPRFQLVPRKNTLVAGN